MTITLTETHLNEKILDSEIRLKNYIGFCADQTLDRKNGGVITYIKATEAVDAEQLIASKCACRTAEQLIPHRCDLWGMKLNVSKTKTMIVSR